MIRQSLAPDAPYVDAVVHGDGLTSLQFRDTPGGPTREVRANVQGPPALRVERHGEFIVMSVSEEAEFAEVRLTPVTPAAGKPRLNSTLEIVPVGSKDRQAIYHSSNHFEAPNWSLDGSHFVFNSQGSLFRLPVKGGTPERIDTGFARRCNNDHGFSPDGKQLVISDHTQAGGKSLIYILPAAPSGNSARCSAARVPSMCRLGRPTAATWRSSATTSRITDEPSRVIAGRPGAYRRSLPASRAYGSGVRVPNSGSSSSSSIVADSTP